MEKTKTFLISYFNNLGCTTPTVINPEAFIKAIASDRWKEQCLSYRRLTRDGAGKQADKIKRGMPAVTVAGIFEEGHRAENLKELSGLVCLDFDKLEESPEKLKESCAQIPHTVAAFTSISGKGLKVMVRVEIAHAGQYLPLYRQVMARYQELTGVAPDKSTSDVCRLCFASWDATPFYNQEATPFRAPVPSGRLQEFLDEKEEEYPLLPGSRHSNLLRLSQAAFRHGFGLGEVLSEALLRYQTPGFEAPEITRILEDAKGYADGKKEPGKEQKRVQKGSFSYRTFFTTKRSPISTRKQTKSYAGKRPQYPDISLIICLIYSKKDSS